MQITTYYSESLSGNFRIDSDKSISHRALIIASCSVGMVRIKNLLESADVLATKRVLQELGVKIESKEEAGGKVYLVYGRGLQSYREPLNILDFANSGTSCRLLMGILSANPITSFLTGDQSLNKRPMARVINPLIEAGAEIYSRQAGELPIMIKGASNLMPIEYQAEISSAQVKSALLLAGLNSGVAVSYCEPQISRDHTEIMLKVFGVEVERQLSDNGSYSVKLPIVSQLNAIHEIEVPSDPSSVAFLVVLGLLAKRSHIIFREVCINPTRIGAYKVLRSMSADIEFSNTRVNSSGEQVADIIVRGDRILKNIEIPANISATMIDEYPILAVAAALSEGRAIFYGLQELTKKESNRLQALVLGLNKIGIKAYTIGDDLYIEGCAGELLIDKDMEIDSFNDHRIAMSFLVLGAIANNGKTTKQAMGGISVKCNTIDTSFPGFIEFMKQAGVNIFIS